LTQEGIQIRERLIEEHEARLRRERSRNRHPLLLSTRKLARITILISGQPDELDHLPGSLATLRSRPALEPEQHIAEHRKVGEERIILENEADAAALRRHVLAPGAENFILETHASFIQLLEAAEDAQRRRLSAATRAQKSEDLSFFHLEIQPTHHRRSGSEALVQIFDGEKWHGALTAIPRAAEGLFRRRISSNCFKTVIYDPSTTIRR